MSTPLLKEYIEIQNKLEERYGERSVVLMMVGSFYEIYGYDCMKLQCGNLTMVSEILGIAKTLKNKSKPHSINNAYMSGFPSYAISKHVSTLLKSNMTIAIYDQHDIKNKKNKMRQLENIISPSTYIDDEVISNNELMCIYVEEFMCPIHKIKLKCGYICHIDLSTGRNKVYECYDGKDNINHVDNEIFKYINSINPCEIITNIKMDNKNILVHKFNDDKELTKKNYQIQFLEKIFGKSQIVNIIEYINLQNSKELLFCYIQLLQFAYEHDPNIVKHIKIPQSNNNSDNLNINSDAFSQLNIINNNNIDLFNIVNNTHTRMGYRLLKSRIIKPITDQKELNNRYNNIDYFINNYDEYKTYLKDINDIEKLFKKIVLNKLLPNQLASLDLSFINISIILKKCLGKFNISKETIDNWKNFITYYKYNFNLKVMKNTFDYKTSFFNKDIYPELDTLDNNIKYIQKMFNKIEGMLENQRANSKIEFTEKEGYCIRTTKKAWDSIKDEDRSIKLSDNKNSICSLSCHIKDFEISKTNGNYLKLKCAAIIDLEKKIKENQDKLENFVKEKYFLICEEIVKNYSNIFNDVIDIISEIDISVSGAITSQKNNYCKPIIDNQEESYINCKNLRHPIIEKIHDNHEYITNDIHLGVNKKCILLFGINSSGKSSLLRAIGTNIILAQSGMYVACDEFKFSIYNKLLTKISCNDDLYKGQSTFVSEMTELKHILLNSDKKTLAMFDELTSGTETESAISICCSSILELLDKRCNLLFTSHLHPITSFDEIKNNKLIDILHFSIDFTKDNFSFNRTLQKGQGEKEYGIEIADRLGLGKSFIKKSYDFRKKLKGENMLFLNTKKSRYNSKVYIDVCQICGVNENLHTHHINEQHTADERGMISHFHKNIKFNLMIVCESCHQSIHHNN
jgi:DNA mismatch repair protein MutS